ncbi:HNH endonuclease [Paracoccus sp. (in: a-proteobacteria)]|uniref:HNH endonuclease n=1 Tax=Paracoccus sp. TaxID=267 RepID=UPI0040590AFB
MSQTKGYYGQWKRNRDAVRRRDPYCIRCYELFDRITPAQECDHLIPRSRGGDHSLANLWMLCGDRTDRDTCHGDKSIRESHGLEGFSPRIDPETGWHYDGDTIEDWQEVIKARNQKRIK